MKTKLKAQVKSRFYYIFWGIATVAVVAGQSMSELDIVFFMVI